MKGRSRSVQFAPLMACASFKLLSIDVIRGEARQAHGFVCEQLDLFGGSLICAVGGRSGMVVMRQEVLSSLVNPVSSDFSAICQPT